VARMVITHSVVDVNRWLAGKAERAAAIGSVGTNVTDYVAQDGSNHVAVAVDVSDLAGVQAMLSTPSAELKALMDKHGVVPPFTAYVEK
jgi:hypothetical protein